MRRILRGICLALCCSWVFTATLLLAQDQNMIRSGTFETLDGWEQNATVGEFGSVTLLPDDHGVLIRNDHYTLDGTLSQTISVDADQWYRVFVKVRPGENAGATVALIALDQTGRLLQVQSPFRISTGGSQWDDWVKTTEFPAGTRAVRVELAVLKGECAYADLRITPDKPPQNQTSEPRPSAVLSGGFTIDRMEIERPLWQLLVDDLDGDGAMDVAACDVDGHVTVRAGFGTPSLHYEPGALVYEFTSADLNGDRRKEILMTSVNPRTALQAIDSEGRVVLTIPNVVGHKHVAAADMNQDGSPEIAAEVEGGVALFTAGGRQLWETRYNICEFQFSDIDPAPGIELVIGYGGPRTRFLVFNREGKQLSEYQDADNQRIFPLHFRVGDIDKDNRQEIVVFRGPNQSYHAGTRMLVCLRGSEVLWNTPLPQYTGDSGLLELADFRPEIPGLECVVAGTHSLFVLDAQGRIVYSWMDDDRWKPGGFRPMGSALWQAEHPELLISSSGLRDPAVYRLRNSNKDALTTFAVPDHERHLDSLYQAAKRIAPLPQVSKDKFKVILTGGWGRVSRETLVNLRRNLDSLESPSVEFVLMYDASDLMGHSRGSKMTTDAIAERARLFEELRLPFGYFAVHSCQVWISDEAIKRTREAAPTMFRFLYTAEDMEGFYKPLHRPFLDWCERMMAWCAQNNLKMLFKDKHDVWGVLPADPEIARRLFKPEYREVIVPIYSTNQVYHPEIQWGGLIGLKKSGLCEEFGMSTQYWNWGEWDVQDLNAAFVCPSDIMLRLELLGSALGGTWCHIEGGQPYLDNDAATGLTRTAVRHRDLVYELMRKNVLQPNAPLANINTTAVVRFFHPEFQQAKAEGRRFMYAYHDRNVPALRRGFIAASHMFEPYAPGSFARLTYDTPWNGSTCFPTTPIGWVPVIPPVAQMPAGFQRLLTDGERVKVKGLWSDSDQHIEVLRAQIQQGAANLLFSAPGACMVVHGPFGSDGRSFRVFLIDPDYLGPTGLETTLSVPGMNGIRVRDLLAEQSLPVKGNTCTVTIPKGAFRVLDVTVLP